MPMLANSTLNLALLCSIAAFAGCGNQSNNNPVFITPLVQWTAPWVSGAQSGPITFQSVGQNVTLSVNTADALFRLRITYRLPAVALSHRPQLSALQSN